MNATQIAVLWLILPFLYLVVGITVWADQDDAGKGIWWPLALLKLLLRTLWRELTTGWRS